MLSHAIVSFTAFELILGGARVVLRPDLTIANAGIADKEIGTAILYSGKSAYFPGSSVGVALVNKPGTVTCIAAGPIPAGSVVKRAAGGQVAADGAGDNFGVALLDAATAAGDYIEILRDPTVLAQVADASVSTGKVAPGAVTGAKLDLTALNTYVAAGVDSTLAAEPIAAVGVVASDRIVSVVDLTTPAALVPANFAAGAGFITQVMAAGNLAAKKLLIQTLPIAS